MLAISESSASLEFKILNAWAVTMRVSCRVKRWMLRAEHLPAQRNGSGDSHGGGERCGMMEGRCGGTRADFSDESRQAGALSFVCASRERNITKAGER